MKLFIQSNLCTTTTLGAQKTYIFLIRVIYEVHLFVKLHFNSLSEYKKNFRINFFAMFPLLAFSTHMVDWNGEIAKNRIEKKIL
jgi:hypothetical protein